MDYMASKIIHIGRKVPKGFREVPGGIHLGGGIWILRMEPIDKEGKDGKRKRCRKN